MRFDFEKLLTFWELRNIVVQEAEPKQKVVGHKRIRLANGTVNLSVLYYKIGDEYELSYVQQITTDKRFGTSMVRLLGDDALEAIESI